MRILFDHKLFYSTHGGASKYFAMLMRHLPQDTWQTTTLLSCNEHVRATGIAPYWAHHFPGQGTVLEHVNRLYSQWRIGRHDSYDVLHQTDFGLYFNHALGRKPLVVTYHDRNMSISANARPEVVKAQAASLHRADAIVAVSQNTRRDLLELFPDVAPEKVHVIYHGIELPTPDGTTQQANSPLFEAPYMLYVGLRAAYKNFSRFLEAFAAFHQRRPEVHLVCTSHPFSAQEWAHIDRLGLRASVHHLLADERQMSCLYRHAVAFVYPSLYEGFGMPILEAWAQHCPCLLSQASCFPEIAQDAALYFDPNDTDAMADAMTRLTDDAAMRQQLITRGDVRVRQFSWQRCADQHADLYHALLNR